jgi:hypothetical protein
MLVIEGLSREKDRGMWNGLLQTILYTYLIPMLEYDGKNISCEKTTIVQNIIRATYMSIKIDVSKRWQLHCGKYE